jgi:Domain of unknown function (DUF4760)
MSIADVITTAINLAALIFLGAQVMLARKATKEAAEGQEQEWGRQRRKSTLDALIASSRYRESLKAVLPWNDRDPREVEAFLKDMSGDHQKLAPVRSYLNHLEDLAVGVNQGVFDLETISMSEGGRIIDTVASYGPYIEGIRRELGRPTIYAEIEDLAKRLEIHRLNSETAARNVAANKPTGHHYLTLRYVIKWLKTISGRTRVGISEPLPEALTPGPTVPAERDCNQ